MTKKVVVFIVEGCSDKKALENIFKKIYKGQGIFFEFMSGDITSDLSIDQDKIYEKIWEKVERCRDYNKFKKSDIWKIIHIIDTDGVYIDDDNIKLSDDDNIVYNEDCICYKNVNAVKERNELKRKNIEYLLKLREIKGVCYNLYYLSCNLDHALYGLNNLTQDEKINYSNKFYGNFISREKLFIDFLKLYVVNGVPDSYKESWKYIKQGNRSLERHTNLHLYFSDNPILYII